jgi:hypothetical protein
MDKFTESDTFIDEGLSEECGFQVTVSYSDKIIVKTFFSGTEPRAFLFKISGWTTFTAADGTTVLVRYAQVVQDPFDGTLTFIGLPIRASVDGHTIVIDAGRLVIGPDGEVIFEGGRHPTFFEGWDICGALSA